MSGSLSPTALGNSSEISGVITSLARPTADILRLKFRPVSSEGPFWVLPFLGDLA